MQCHHRRMTTSGTRVATMKAPWYPHRTLASVADQRYRQRHHGCPHAAHGRHSCPGCVHTAFYQFSRLALERALIRAIRQGTPLERMMAFLTRDPGVTDMKQLEVLINGLRFSHGPRQAPPHTPTVVHRTCEAERPATQTIRDDGTGSGGLPGNMFDASNREQRAASSAVHGASYSGVDPSEPHANAIQDMGDLVAVRQDDGQLLHVAGSLSARPA